MFVKGCKLDLSEWIIFWQWLTFIVAQMSVCSAGDPGSIPGSGRCLGERNGNQLQYSCLENPMDWGAWWATVHPVAESDMTEATKHACVHVKMRWKKSVSFPRSPHTPPRPMRKCKFPAHSADFRVHAGLGSSDLCFLLWSHFFPPY